MSLPKKNYRQWLPRESLVEGWYVDYSSIGGSYGNEVARQAEILVLQKMTRVATNISYHVFCAQADQDESEWIMLASPLSLGYRSIWREHFQGFERETNEAQQAPGYGGEYRIGSSKLTAYSINSPFPLPFSEDSVLVIPKSMLGQIRCIAQEPTEGQNKEVVWAFKKTMGEADRKIWVGIGVVHEDTKKKLSDNPPPWLRDIGETTAQENWLETHIVLNVATKMDWQYPSGQTMYLVSP